jgi:hypothetical protein
MAKGKRQGKPKGGPKRGRKASGGTRTSPPATAHDREENRNQNGKEDDDDRVDRALWLATLWARHEGRKGTRDQERGFARYEKKRVARERAKYYAAVPKGFWLEASGRSAQVVNRQADTYGAPLRGDTIDLAKLAKWLHDFWAENARALALARSDETDPLLVGPESPAMERCREARAGLLELELDTKKGNLLERRAVHEWAGRISHIIRDSTATLQRDFGPQAAQIIEEALDDADAEIQRAFGNKNNGKE